MLGSRLLFAGLFSSVGIGSVTPLSSLLAGGGDPTIWRVKSQESFPLFTCSSDKARIRVSLALEKGAQDTSLGNSTKVIFTGWDEKARKPVSLYDNDRAGVAPFQLTIFGTGTFRLGESGNWESSHGYGGTLNCDKDKNVFKVESYNYDYQNEKQWEKDFNSISLTLSECSSKDGGRQKCSIKIDSGAGLAWKTEFTPKAII